jgi:prophage regulatory protein
MADKQYIDRFLKLPQVMEMTGLRHDSVYRLEKNNDFPRRRKLSERASAWLESEILAWMRNRPFGETETIEEEL